MTMLATLISVNFHNRKRLICNQYISLFYICSEETYLLDEAMHININIFSAN